MSKYEKIYEELNKQFSAQEIAGRYVFPGDLNEQEKQEIEKEFRELRLKSLKERTEEQRENVSRPVS